MEWWCSINWNLYFFWDASSNSRTIWALISDSPCILLHSSAVCTPNWPPVFLNLPVVLKAPPTDSFLSISIKQCSQVRESDWLILSQVTTSDPISGAIYQKNHEWAAKPNGFNPRWEFKLALERQTPHHYHPPSYLDTDQWHWVLTTPLLGGDGSGGCTIQGLGI